MNETVRQSVTQSIHPATRLGLLVLRVSNADRSRQFYEDALGFKRLGEVRGMPALGAGDVPLVLLKETGGARMARRFSGLYHFAVLLPSRAALGQVLRRLAEAAVDIGQADHLVSEALYLSDPDGNGIEMYRDRPRSEWKWSNGTVQMATDPLDLEDLIREGDAAEQSQLLPDGTTLGHMHLQVSDVPQAVRLYHDLIGFDVTAQWHGAAFLSAGGYHHHLGLNSWASHGAPAADPGAPGLESFSIIVPDGQELDRLEAKLTEAGIRAEREPGVLRARDPWNIGVEIEAQA